MKPNAGDGKCLEKLFMLDIKKQFSRVADEFTSKIYYTVE